MERGSEAAAFASTILLADGPHAHGKPWSKLPSKGGSKLPHSKRRHKDLWLTILGPSEL